MKKKDKSKNIFSNRFDDQLIEVLSLCGYIDRRNNTVIKGKGFNKMINRVLKEGLAKAYSRNNPNIVLYENLYKNKIEIQKEIILNAKDEIASNLERIKILRKETDEKLMNEVLSRKK